MRFLLLFLCIGFSGIFYVFSYLFQSQNSLESLFFDSKIGMGAFLFLGVILFLYFSATKPIQIDDSSKEPIINTQEILAYIKIFFRKYIYYIGFLFFYGAWYLILLWIGKGERFFSYGIFFLNIGIFLLFFLTGKFFILRDFLKINTLVFSGLYIIYYLFFLIFWIQEFVWIEFLNSVLLFCLLLLFLTFKKPDERQWKSDPVILVYFSIYLFLWAVFYGNFLFSSVSLSFCFFAFVVWIVLFYLPSYASFFKNSFLPIRITATFFVAISLLSSVFAILQGQWNIIPVMVIILWSMFSFWVHYLYQNYFSLCCGFLSLFALFSTFYFSYVYVTWQENIFLWIYIATAFILVLITYVYRLKYHFDTLFFHVFAYIMNVFALGGYFFITNIDILHIGIILLIESFFIFFSYYKINLLYQWSQK